MNTRRKFLVQGSMATTALLVSKPFKTFANTIAPVTGFSINDDKVVLVHTGDYQNSDHHQTIKHIADLKNNAGNMVLLHAANVIWNSAEQLKYDASMSADNNLSIATNDHKIIYKGNIKIGIVTANNSETNTIDKINTTAAYLKKEKDCNIVVCLSQLGYKNKNTVDDISLATGSTNLDIIVGGHEKNFCKQPFIALNKNKEEVIINHAVNKFALGKIEIDFDGYGKKRNVVFNNNVLKSIAANHS